MTASHPVFKPVTLPDFQNGNDTGLTGGLRVATREAAEGVFCRF